MNHNTLDALTRELRRQRGAILKEVDDAEATLAGIAEERESELEERACDDRAARLYTRLDLRGKREIEEIDAALQRVADGRYGLCADCNMPIPIARLRALPATRLCVACAGARESAPPTPEGESDQDRQGPLPADLGLLSGLEAETALRELVAEDGRVDLEELRVVCRHGVVYLDGALPSAAEHQIMLKLLTDVAGVREVVDRVQIREILWERPDRSKAMPEEEVPSRIEPTVTDDIVKSTEEGINFVPPTEPPPEEEE